MAAHWPITVARAAPVTPMAGAPSQPKIRMGSRTMLRAAPVTWASMGTKVLPRACSSLVQWDSTNSPSDPASTTRAYWTPCCRTRGWSDERAKYPCRAARVTQANRAKSNTPSHRPLLMVSRWAAVSPQPSIRAMRMPRPVPAPVARAVVSSWMGKTSDKAVSPLREYWATK